jgi:hypothetical protein
LEKPVDYKLVCCGVAGTNVGFGSFWGKDPVNLLFSSTGMLSVAHLRENNC